jgi:hypothetical protein
MVTGQADAVEASQSGPSTPIRETRESGRVSDQDAIRLRSWRGSERSARRSMVLLPSAMLPGPDLAQETSRAGILEGAALLGTTRKAHAVHAHLLHADARWCRPCMLRSFLTRHGRCHKHPKTSRRRIQGWPVACTVARLPIGLPLPGDSRGDAGTMTGIFTPYPSENYGHGLLEGSSSDSDKGSRDTRSLRQMLPPHPDQPFSRSCRIMCEARDRRGRWHSPVPATILGFPCHPIFS